MDRKALGPLLVVSYLSLAGCETSSLPASANKTLADHIDTSLSPQQRIDKIQNNPRLSDEQKANAIKAVKERNHLN